MLKLLVFVYKKKQKYKILSHLKGFRFQLYTAYVHTYLFNYLLAALSHGETRSQWVVCAMMFAAVHGNVGCRHHLRWLFLRVSFAEHRQQQPATARSHSGCHPERSVVYNNDNKKVQLSLGWADRTACI